MKDKKKHNVMKSCGSFSPQVFRDEIYFLLS